MKKKILTNEKTLKTMYDILTEIKKKLTTETNASTNDTDDTDDIDSLIQQINQISVQNQEIKPDTNLLGKNRETLELEPEMLQELINQMVEVFLKLMMYMNFKLL